MGVALKAKPLHIGATLLSIETNFIRQQLMLTRLDSGLSKGAFGRRDKDISAEEHAQDYWRKYEALLQAMKEWATLLGHNITALRDDIDQNIEKIDSLLDQLDELQPAEAHQAKIEQLQEDKEEFIERKRVLDEIDTQRQKSTPENFEQTQSRYESFAESYTAFKERFKKRDTSSAFNEMNTPAPKANNHTPKTRTAPDYEWDMEQNSPNSQTSSKTTATEDDPEKKLQEALERLRSAKDDNDNGPKSPPPVPTPEHR